MGDLKLGANNTLYLIDKAIEKKYGNESPRQHLGASSLGNPCMRALWYQFRWHETKSHEARMLRIFQRGHNEEETFIKYYKLAGFKVFSHDADGKQFWFQAKNSGGHIGGCIDAFVSNLAENPEILYIVDFKTSKNSKFNELKKKRLKEGQPRHYSQLQLYMHWSGTHKAFYHSVNKDTDEFYAEYLDYDQKFCEDLENKGFKVVKSHVPPERISNKKDWWQCKMCEFYETCHHDRKRSVNCRTCRFSSPVLGDNNEKMWKCEKLDKDIDYETQRKACEKWSDIEHD